MAIPLVKVLTAEVKKSDPEAARFVHWGATSQDIIDTALVLELRAGIDALAKDLERAVRGFAALAQQHRHTPVAGRTWLQHAVPIPLGLKLAGYAAALGRARERLVRLRSEALPLQFGGAWGQSSAAWRSRPRRYGWPSAWAAMASSRWQDCGTTSATLCTRRSARA